MSEHLRIQSRERAKVVLNNLARLMLEARKHPEIPEELSNPEFYVALASPHLERLQTSPNDEAFYNMSHEGDGR